MSCKTDRERLIELIQNAVNGCARHWAEIIADYLLANGVIVPPCKVGDTVYVISRGEVIPLEVDTILNNRKGVSILGRNEKYWGNGTVTLYPDKRIVEWYLTKEEAEAELEKRGKENG